MLPAACGYRRSERRAHVSAEITLAPAENIARPGHPKGLFFLAFTEAWERFSYYGMTALVVLYMVNYLLLPGHVEQVVGFAAFRAVIESLTGPLSTQALASYTFGLYAGFVYFTPVIGGMIADRWIGQRNAVVIGALSMCAGHIAMTFDEAFLVALLLLVAGSGFLKGNISAQVGALYPPDDNARRTRGFVLFYMAINVGALLGPLLCGLLAQLYGWHYGFGLASMFMLIALAVYLYGYRHLPARVRRQSHQQRQLTHAERRTIFALVCVIAITIFQSTAYYQIYNAMPVWLQQHVSLNVGGFQIPIPWFQSIDPLFSMLGVPLLFWVWRRQAMRGREPDEIAKIGIGAAFAAAANLLLVAGIVHARGAAVHPLWPFLYSVGVAIGFLYYWPTLLALVSRAAPARANATLMGFALLSLFVSNNLIGWLGGFYERMHPAEFWSVHALIAAAGGFLVLTLGPRLRRVLG